ncbi:MAG: methylenetetrahydrofolate--tRNA-(uracil(54)-C(5))-methyltransferase (FADH(2)-oxidizing) TrmFO [Methylocystaceae bacterium]
MPKVKVIGGGLAGCEAAWQLARSAVEVDLYEMRPNKMTAVHQTGYLAELVCSNSLKSETIDTAQGLLKAEMRQLGSIILDSADTCRVPAGSALAVDRIHLAQEVTRRLQEEPAINIIHEEVTTVPDDPAIIATGPLTGGEFWHSLQALCSEESLFFYDAVAPIVTADSIDMQRAFKAARYNKGGADYINCPLYCDEYEQFYQELITADQHEGHIVDTMQVFEGCMPVEVMASRGIDTMRYGPMRPVGLPDPVTGEQYYAVLQLRQEDLHGSLYGLVGFQSRLRWTEQDRIFRLIPALKNAEFVRYGVMHRNSYINSPRLLRPTLQFAGQPQLFAAGQITGVEGYMESAASGIIAGINMARLIQGKEPWVWPRETMIGSLINYICTSPGDKLSPMNANFGILPPLERIIRNKKQRYEAYSNRAIRVMKEFSELLS